MKNDDNIERLAKEISALKEQDLPKKIEQIQKELASIKAAAEAAQGNTSGVGASIFFASVFIAFLLALTSNPQHAAHLAQFTSRLTGDDPTYSAIRAQFPSLEPYVLSRYITYDSFWIWSVGKLKLGEKEVPISFGIFGNVFDYGTPADLKKKFGNEGA